MFWSCWPTLQGAARSTPTATARAARGRQPRGAMSGAMSGPLSEIDIHKLNSGQKLNMIMCARFNLPSFTPSPYLLAPLPLLPLLFLIILFFIDFRKRQRNSQATYATSDCGPPATLKMKRFSLKIMLPYAIVCVCVNVLSYCMYVCASKCSIFGQNDSVLKIGNQNRKKRPSSRSVSKSDGHPLL